MMDGADRVIEPVRQLDLAAGEIYNVKQISPDSRQANDKQFEKQFKKEQEKDEQDKADKKKASQENHYTDDSPDRPDYPAGIQDDLILSSEAKEILNRNDPPEKNSTPEDNGKDNNSSESGEEPGINLKA